MVVLSDKICMSKCLEGMGTLPCKRPQEATADGVSQVRSLLQAWPLLAHLWGEPPGHRAAPSGAPLLALLRSAMVPILAR